MRSKLSQKRTSTIITNVCVVLYSLFLFMLKIYAFVGVFIAITALKGNKEFPNLHFEYLQLFFFFINHFVPLDLPSLDYVANISILFNINLNSMILVPMKISIENYLNLIE